jgi:hypothetical protein
MADQITTNPTCCVRGVGFTIRSCSSVPTADSGILIVVVDAMVAVEVKVVDAMKVVVVEVKVVDAMKIVPRRNMDVTLMVQQLVGAMKMVDALKMIVLSRGNSVGMVVDGLLAVRILVQQLVDAMKVVDALKMIVLPRNSVGMVGMHGIVVLAVMLHNPGTTAYMWMLRHEVVGAMKMVDTMKMVVLPRSNSVGMVGMHGIVVFAVMLHNPGTAA